LPHWIIGHNAVGGVGGVIPPLYLAPPLRIITATVTDVLKTGQGHQDADRGRIHQKTDFTTF
ncbi:hypothetical protein WA026_010655, partial [Henosepilachna vigintioctopunctata]